MSVAMKVVAFVAAVALSSGLACGHSSGHPIVVNTWPFVNATAMAWRALQSGEPAVEAVVQGASVCEVEQCDGTVGYGGSPDEAGETTLDAMVIDGTTMNTGAVGALRNIKAAARAAALVKDHTHHSILVGDQATAFAVEMGLPYTPLTTQPSAALHRAWEDGACQPNFRARVSPPADASCGPYQSSVVHQGHAHSRPSQAEAAAGAGGTPTSVRPPRRSLTADQADITEADVGSGASARPSRRCGQGWPGPGAHDTIAILATDTRGHTAAATSTNGNCGKVPGRVGDAAVPGAGAYAVSGVGACGATGDGDVMMRFLPCYQAVESMRAGMSATEAAEDAIRRIHRGMGAFQGALVTLAANGDHGGAGLGWVFHYSVASGDTGGLVRVIEVPPLQL